MRVCVGITEIAGYCGNLVQGLRAVGLDAVHVCLSQGAFYDVPPANRLVALCRALARPAGGRFSRLFRGLLRRAALFALVLWACVRFDTFVFNFGVSFWPGHRDLRLLRLLGKKVVFVFLGSDARPPYCDGAWLLRPDPPSAAEVAERAARMKADIATIERYAHHCVVEHASAHFFEKPCVSFLHLGLPQPARAAANPAESAPREAVRILHAPSMPAAKGTPRVREIIEGLKAQGLAVEYRELTGVPHARVLEELAGCDFVFDQLYSPTPLAGLASEAASFGRPALVGGYYARELARLLPEAAMPPSLYVHPDDAAEEAYRLAGDAALRQELGGRAARFMREAWSAPAVAARFARLLGPEGPDPAWVFDPASIRYLHGACLPEAEARAWVRKVLEQGGRGALRLSDKPELEELYARFAEGGA